MRFETAQVTLKFWNFGKFSAQKMKKSNPNLSNLQSNFLTDDKMIVIHVSKLSFLCEFFESFTLKKFTLAISPKNPFTPMVQTTGTL